MAKILLFVMSSTSYFFIPLAPPVSRKPFAKGLWSIFSWVTFSF